MKKLLFFLLLLFCYYDGWKLSCVSGYTLYDWLYWWNWRNSTLVLIKCIILKQRHILPIYMTYIKITLQDDTVCLESCLRENISTKICLCLWVKHYSACQVVAVFISFISTQMETSNSEIWIRTNRPAALSKIAHFWP